MNKGESAWEGGCEQGGVSVGRWVWTRGSQCGNVGVNKGESVWEGGCEQGGVSVGRWV